MDRSVLILAGATASGKTELALDLAQRFNAEIVGADSRQIYCGMPIGTAAPTPAQQAAVPHHLIGFLDPRERYSAARYAQDALRAVQAIQARGKRAVVAGGTGFYIRALSGDVQLAPHVDEGFRVRLASEARVHDAEFLHDWLRVRDPGRAEAIQARDTYRVLRALEVAIAPPQAQLRAEPLESLASAGIPFLKVAIAVEIPELERRIADRAERMLRDGLLEEAQRIGPDALAASAVGYPQALAFLRGWFTYAELREALSRATRRYAKRQLRWFRAEPGMRFARADQVAGLARENLGWL